MNRLWAHVHIPRFGASHLDFHGDNRKFVVETFLPAIPSLPPRVVQVIRWAYGYDGSPRSFEQESDGSTVVPDQFLGGLIKEPWGVAHDMLCALLEAGLSTPDGHVWTWLEAANWYWLAVRVFGYHVRACTRWFGIMIWGLISLKAFTRRCAGR